MPDFIAIIMSFLETIEDWGWPAQLATVFTIVTFIYLVARRIYKDRARIAAVLRSLGSALFSKLEAVAAWLSLPLKITLGMVLGALIISGMTAKGQNVLGDLPFISDQETTCTNKSCDKDEHPYAAFHEATRSVLSGMNGGTRRIAQPSTPVLPLAAPLPDGYVFPVGKGKFVPRDPQSSVDMAPGAHGLPPVKDDLEVDPPIDLLSGVQPEAPVEPIIAIRIARTDEIIPSEAKASDTGSDHRE